jgi:AAA15 family ATPase/GTPase
MTDKMIEQLEEYFKNSKRDFWIGIQNFQGVRGYTKIPLAPITLLYGQNSAGKSTVHDALLFIHSFLGGKWDSNTTEEHLDRWANHHRVSTPLIKDYLGNPDDVVISISASATVSNYFDWESEYYKNQDFVREEPAYQLFSIEPSISFQIDMFFSNQFKKNNNEEWIIRQVSLYLGGDLIVDLTFDENDYTKSNVNQVKYYHIKINKKHTVYSFIDSFFGHGIEGVISNSLIDDSIIGASIDENLIYLSNLQLDDSLEWKKPIDWSDYDCENWESLPSDELRFRDLVASLFMVPSLAASDKIDFNSVPPIRPIPSKKSVIFRSSAHEIAELSCWSYLASYVRAKFISDNFPVIAKEKNEPPQIAQDIVASFLGVPYHTGHSVLDQVNRILSHPLFLNTDYEISGECLFLTPINVFNVFNESTDKSNDEMQELLHKLDAEIHLMLKQKSNGQLIEIEDVGVGVSQIIPVLFAIVAGSRQVFIQQPELHLHPKLQAQLADAFIEQVYKNIRNLGYPCFVVESHSEHFLLRLLRRIRETHKSDIKNKLFSLSSQHVSVLYVDKLEDGSSKIFPLRLSPEGEFIDRWPHGFFTERDGELFDE